MTPSLGAGGKVAGYHSNRRVPARRVLDQVRPLYASLRATESRHPRPADALEASMAQLDGLLAERGESYDQFIWSLTADVVRP